MSYIQKQPLEHVSPRVTVVQRLQSATVLRALVLVLVLLLLIVVVLMPLTGRYGVGGLVLGGILMIGLGASNYTR